MKEYERGKTMKVYTIKDIAAMAGVSVTTVSRVLNHRPDVNIATREKVEQIIRDCHFVGNTNARGLKQGNEVIGVVIRGRSNPFLSSLAEAILDRADTVPDNFVTEYIDEKADVRTSLEFESLSDNINTTVARIRAMAEKEAKAV